jgi:hypothetical protein
MAVFNPHKGSIRCIWAHLPWMLRKRTRGSLPFTEPHVLLFQDNRFVAKGAKAMAYNPKEDGWASIFVPRNKVELPEQLTKKWWDKNKQTIAKMTKSTGVGEALAEVEDAFQKVAFPEFNPHITLVQEGVDEAKKFITSAPVKKLHDALKDAKNLAKEQAAGLKKNPLTKKTAGVLEEIHEVADILMVSVNPNSLSARLKEALERFMKKQDEAAIKNAPAVIAAADSTRKTMSAKIKSLRDRCEKFDDEKERGYLFNEMFTLGRNMTQSLGNLLKADKAGVPFLDFDSAAIKKLLDQLVPIGGAQSHSAFSAKLDQTLSGKLIDKFEAWGDEYIKLTKDIELPELAKV